MGRGVEQRGRSGQKERSIEAKRLSGVAEAVVERSFSWIDQNRRMSNVYERLPESSEAFIYVAMTRLMVRRLARS